MAADRVSKIIAQTEYTPDEKRRVSKIFSEVEYTPFEKRRVSKVIICVEYTSNVVPRKYGPAIQMM